MKDSWTHELYHKVAQIGTEGYGEDEKYAGGVYDMYIDIAQSIERVVGHEFDNKDIDNVVEVIYNAIKYGEGVDRTLGKEH